MVSGAERPSQAIQLPNSFLLFSPGLQVLVLHPTTLCFFCLFGRRYGIPKGRSLSPASAQCVDEFSPGLTQKSQGFRCSENTIDEVRLKPAFCNSLLKTKTCCSLATTSFGEKPIQEPFITKLLRPGTCLPQTLSMLSTDYRSCQRRPSVVCQSP
jgi:hypothetical protein